jgi:hypothetical protein
MRLRRGGVHAGKWRGIGTACAGSKGAERVNAMDEQLQQFEAESFGCFQGWRIEGLNSRPKISRGARSSTHHILTMHYLTS